MSGRAWRNLAASVVVSAVFLFLAFRHVPLAELALALHRVRVDWLAVAIAISIVLMAMRTWRWQLELVPLERVAFGPLWVVTATAYLAINVFPARLGEVVRPWLLSRRSRLTFAMVVGNLVVEKTMDSVVLLVYIFAGLLTVEHLPAWVRHGAAVPAVGAAVLVALVLLLWSRGEAFVDRWVLRLVPERAGRAIKRVLSAVVSGMQVLPNPRLMAAVFALSLGLWFLPILSSYVVIRAFGLVLPFSAAVVVFIFIGFGTALPNMPGMIGPYQYACVLALELFGVAKVDALAYGLVLNAIQFLSILAQGLIALPFTGVRWSDVRRAAVAPPHG
jgi:uncharacterized protein (TIRG00374 family)